MFDPDLQMTLKFIKGKTKQFIYNQQTIVHALLVFCDSAVCVMYSRVTSRQCISGIAC